MEPDNPSFTSCGQWIIYIYIEQNIPHHHLLQMYDGFSDMSGSSMSLDGDLPAVVKTGSIRASSFQVFLQFAKSRNDLVSYITIDYWSEGTCSI